MDRNEIVERLKHIAKHAVHTYGEVSPFVIGLDDGIAINEAVAILRAQEPRVLTLEEAINGPQVGYLEFKYHPERGWVKCDFITHLKDKEVIFLFSADVTFYQQEESYGELWRLWTSRPTDEQRKATKWDEPLKEG